MALNRNKLKEKLLILTNQNILPWFICLLAFIIMGIISPSLFSKYSITSLLASTTPVFVMSAGEIIVMIVGSIDLTLAASVGFSSVFAAGLFMNSKFPIPITIIIVLIIGGLIGLLNGVIITKGKLQSFIVTIGMSVVIRGITLIYSRGTSIPLKGEGLRFSDIFSKTMWGVPAYFYIGAVIIILLTIFIINTVFGRYLNATGGSEVAARINGLRSDSLRIKAFVLAGFLYALAGLVLLAQFGTGWPQAASGWEMDGIATSVLGGANFAGGIGLPIGAIPGAIVLDLILRFLVTIGIDPYWQYAVKGIFVIAVAVALARGEYGR
jgi:ribose transport system permease protein